MYKRMRVRLLRDIEVPSKGDMRPMRKSMGGFARPRTLYRGDMVFAVEASNQPQDSPNAIRLWLDLPELKHDAIGVPLYDGDFEIPRKVATPQVPALPGMTPLGMRRKNPYPFDDDEEGMADYAWIIDRDHLAEKYDDRGDDVYGVGTVGPRGADPKIVAKLESNKKFGMTFKLYDDDRVLYYTGRIWIREGKLYEEEYSCAPLFDFGEPNAGCTDIRYPGRPHLDCG